MNVNPILMGLKEATGFPVVPDLYEGAEDKYITFTYEDERAALYGDGEELATEVTVQISLFTPHRFNYFIAKDQIRDYLKAHWFQIESIQSWIAAEKKGASRYRQTVFSANYTQ